MAAAEQAGGPVGVCLPVRTGVCVRRGQSERIKPVYACMSAILRTARLFSITSSDHLCCSTELVLSYARWRKLSNLSLFSFRSSAVWRENSASCPIFIIYYLIFSCFDGTTSHLNSVKCCLSQPLRANLLVFHKWSCCNLVGKDRHTLLLRGGRRGFDLRQLWRTKRAFFPPLALWNED